MLCCLYRTTYNKVRGVKLLEALFHCMQNIGGTEDTEQLDIYFQQWQPFTSTQQCIKECTTHSGPTPVFHQQHGPRPTQTFLRTLERADRYIGKGIGKKKRVQISTSRPNETVHLASTKLLYVFLAQDDIPTGAFVDDSFLMTFVNCRLLHSNSVFAQRTAKVKWFDGPTETVSTWSAVAVSVSNRTIIIDDLVSHQRRRLREVLLS